MQANQSMLIKKLGVFGILKESLKIPCNNPKFIFTTFLTSLPLIFTMVLHEIIIQTTMIETKTFLTPPPVPFYNPFMSYYFPETSLQTSIRLFEDMSPRVFQLGLLYFVPLHLLDLFNTITTVNLTSTIYVEEKPVNTKEVLLILLDDKRVKGPLATSVYVLALNSLVLFGMIWAVTNSIIPSLGAYFVFLYGILSITLLVKWMEWSAIWNMSIVLSVLEEIHGLEAFGVSGYFSRGNKRRGLYLMLVFLVWRSVLRLSCIYVGGNENWGALAATSVLSCAGNVMKWVVCTVYFYDCKKRVLDKKVDMGEERKVNISKVDSV